MGHTNHNSKITWLEIVKAMGVLLGGAAALTAALLGGEGISSLFPTEEERNQPQNKEIETSKEPQISIENNPNININNQPAIELSTPPKVNSDTPLEIDETTFVPPLQAPLIIEEPPSIISSVPFGTASKSWCLAAKDQWEVRQEKSSRGLESIKASMEEANCQHWGVNVP